MPNEFQVLVQRSRRATPHDAHVHPHHNAAWPARILRPRPGRGGYLALPAHRALWSESAKIDEQTPRGESGWLPGWCEETGCFEQVSALFRTTWSGEVHGPLEAHVLTEVDAVPLG